MEKKKQEKKRKEDKTVKRKRNRNDLFQMNLGLNCLYDF